MRANSIGESELTRTLRYILPRPMAPAFDPQIDPLSSWNDSASKASIIEFLQAITNPRSDSFVQPVDRIATFDNDGTLWSEQPMYTEMAFLIDLARELAPQHPEWKDKSPFDAVLRNDIETVVAGGGPNVYALAVELAKGMNVSDYHDRVIAWLSQVRHPQTGRSYLEMSYRPMRELLRLLHSLDFKVFIVSGGTVDFVRPWAEDLYGVPKHKIVGSAVALEFCCIDTPKLKYADKMHFVDDGTGKPVGIHRSIGRHPVIACGNSDGDLPMFEWASSSPLPHLCVLIHHTDAEREWAYDTDSHVGRLHDALITAHNRQWTFVDMQQDWKQVFDFQA